MPERMDWKNALCATNNFRYKLIRYKENVYAVYAFSKRKHIF